MATLSFIPMGVGGSSQGGSQETLPRILSLGLVPMTSFLSGIAWTLKVRGKKKYVKLQPKATKNSPKGHYSTYFWGPRSGNRYLCGIGSFGLG